MGYSFLECYLGLPRGCLFIERIVIMKRNNTKSTAFFSLEKRVLKGKPVVTVILCTEDSYVDYSTSEYDSGTGEYNKNNLAFKISLAKVFLRSRIKAGEKLALEVEVLKEGGKYLYLLLIPRDRLKIDIFSLGGEDI